MVKVLSSFVRGPLEPHVTGFAEELLRQGYSRSSASQHVCFIAHLDRWMQATGVGLDQLTGPVIERYLVGRRAAGYRQYWSWRAVAPLLEYLAPLGVLPTRRRFGSGRSKRCWAATAPGCSPSAAWPSGRSVATWTACDRSSRADCAEMFWIWPG